MQSAIAAVEGAMRRVLDAATLHSMPPLTQVADTVGTYYSYSLLTTCYSLLTTHYPLLTTYYSLPTINYPLPTTHYPLLTSHYSLLTTHYSLYRWKTASRSRSLPLVTRPTPPTLMMRTSGGKGVTLRSSRQHCRSYLI